MARATTIALSLCLAGCHVLFGHSSGPGAGSADGQSRVDGRPPDGRAGERSDGEVGRDGTAPKEGMVVGPELGLPPDLPVCDPQAQWCVDLQQLPVGATLYDVDGTDDASVVYAVGVGVVLRSTSSQRIWQTVGMPVTGVEWRGVEVLESSKDAVVVGNQGKTPVAYRVSQTAATPINVASVLSGHTLYAVWMQDEESGLAATGVVTNLEPHGTLSPLAKTQLSAGNDLGEQIFDVGGYGSDGWAVGSAGSVRALDGSTWSSPLYLPGVMLRVAALGPKAMCAVTLSGDVTCCAEFLGITCPISYPRPGARALASSGKRLVVVGDGGAIASAQASLIPGPPPKPQLGPFTDEAIATETLHGVWIARPQPGAKEDAWAVGEKGLILHRQY